MITASALVFPSVEAMEDANRHPPINFCLNPENIALRETLSRAVVLQDSQGNGAVFIEAHLNRAFHRHGWKWFARAIPGNRFLLDPPDEAWRTKTLSKRSLWLGGVWFPIEPYNINKHNVKPTPTCTTWIKVKGLPYELWTDSQFQRIATEAGGYLIAVDPTNLSYMDLTVLRLKIGIPNTNVIPKGRHMMFDTPKGKEFHFLHFEYEPHVKSVPQSSPSGHPNAVVLPKPSITFVPSKPTATAKPSISSNPDAPSNPLALPKPSMTSAPSNPAAPDKPSMSSNPSAPSTSTPSTAPCASCPKLKLNTNYVYGPLDSIHRPRRPPGPTKKVRRTVVRTPGGYFLRYEYVTKDEFYKTMQDFLTDRAELQTCKQSEGEGIHKSQTSEVSNSTSVASDDSTNEYVDVSTLPPDAIISPLAFMGEIPRGALPDAGPRLLSFSNSGDETDTATNIIPDALEQTATPGASNVPQTYNSADQLRGPSVDSSANLLNEATRSSVLKPAKIIYKRRGTSHTTAQR